MPLFDKVVLENGVICRCCHPHRKSLAQAINPQEPERRPPQPPQPRSRTIIRPSTKAAFALFWHCKTGVRARSFKSLRRADVNESKLLCQFSFLARCRTSAPQRDFTSQHLFDLGAGRARYFAHFKTTATIGSACGGSDGPDRASASGDPSPADPRTTSTGRSFEDSGDGSKS